MMNKRITYSMLIVGIACLCYGYYLQISPVVNEVTNDGLPTQSVNVILITEHYRDGELIEKQVKDDDLILDNFAKIIESAFHGYSAIPYAKPEDAGSVGLFGGNNYEGSSSRIQIGTDNTAPATTDYLLIGKTYDESVEQVTFIISGNEMNVTAFCSFGITGTYGINEVGLFYETQTDNDEIMACRDVLPSTINVVDGDVLTVKYVLQFN